MSKSLSLLDAASGFAAMGAPARLDIIRLLVRAGHQGLTITTIRERLGIPASTLAHHLECLVQANLIQQSKQGRTCLNVAHFQHLENLAAFLLHECCKDENP
ncbi:MAG: winged helix-turn-helix domain-containing protein [Pseudomonadota bacterium]